MSTPPPALPIDLTELLRVGAVYQGRAVHSISLTWEGGEMKSQLQTPESTDAEIGLQPRKKILEALAASEIPLSRKQLARKIGLKDARGRFSTVVSKLLETGEVFELDGFLTDDASKQLDD